MNSLLRINSIIHKTNRRNKKGKGICIRVFQSLLTKQVKTNSHRTYRGSCIIREFLSHSRNVFYLYVFPLVYMIKDGFFHLIKFIIKF